MTLFSVHAQIDTIKAPVMDKICPTSFFDTVSSHSEIRFFYKKEWFDTLEIKNQYSGKTLKDVLNNILQDTYLVYEVIDSNIVFLPKKYARILSKSNQSVEEKIERDVYRLIIGKFSEAGKYEKVTISGNVTDGKNGKPLIATTVVVKNSTIGTITDNQGNYRLDLKPGFYTLEFSNIGYEKISQKVKIVSNGKFDAQLFEESIKLDEVAVYAKKNDRNVTRNQMSIIEMDAKDIESIPVITGEKDIIKGLTSMPGVKSIGEFGSGISVRGGGEDQNLYLLEGAPLFNTTHVFGLLSVINPDAVKGFTLYKGHIPAGYGERVSSVMEIKLKDNNINQFKMKGGIGIYNSRLLIETPVIEDKLSFKVGGRTSYSDWLLGQMGDYYLKNSSATFYDFFSQVNWHINKDHYTLTGYLSKDDFNYASILSYGYGNKLASLKWTRNIGNNLASSFMTSYSCYKADSDDIKDDFYKKRITSGINQLSFKWNVNHSFSLNEIDVGIQVNKYRLNPGHETPLEENTLISERSLKQEQGVEIAGYLNGLFDVNEFFSINAGVRYSVYQYLGPNTLHKYENSHLVSENLIIDTLHFSKNESIVSYNNLEPRISLKFQLSDNNSLKMSYNRNSQYINLLSYTSISTPDDRWKLSDPYIKPVSSNHVALGYYHNFFDNKMETSVEAYYKKSENLKEYKNNASIPMNDHVETELLNAQGNNFGIEFLVEKNFGMLNGWLSYTWSRSFRKTTTDVDKEKINNNQFFPSTFDKPNDLSIVANYHFNRRVSLSGNFSYATGRPVTIPKYQYQAADNMLIYYSERNTYRLPPYHRFDISLKIDESLRKDKKWKGRWTFSILNLYGRKNPYSVFYKKQIPNYDNDYRWFSMYKMYLIGRPFPTITYSFVFNK